MKAGAVTLGDALEFSALSTDGNVSINNVAKVGIAPIGPQGDVGGDSVVLGNNSLAGGNVDADPGDITLGNFSKVNGECITDGGSITKGIGAKCHTESTAGDGGLKAQAITDVGTFVTALLAATPTETLPALTVKNFPGTTLPLAAGLNIIEIPSVTLNNSSTLTLNGEGLGGTVVLEIDGTLKIGSGSKIVLAGGLTAADVVIYVGGSIATWGNTTTINGTVLVPNAAVSAGSGAKVFGAIIAGDDVTFLENAGLTFDPTLVDIPSNVPPPPLTLGDAAPFLLVSTDGNTKLGNVTLANPAAPNAGEIGGISDTFGSNSVIQGNVIALEGGPDITLGNFTKVKSTCYTNGGTVSLGSGASCASTDATVNAPPVLGLIGAGPDASSFEAGAASFPVDQFLAAIKIAAGKTQTISTGPNPVTVFDTPSITLGGSATLKIVGTAGQIAVINVTGGALTLGPGFTIALSGGITADSVVFNVESTSPTPALIGGTSSTFNGTLVASARACQVNTGAAINGQIVCGGDVTVGDNLTAAYVPLVPIPFP
jgi:predicted acyltransferase (DUF342 family)